MRIEAISAIIVATVSVLSFGMKLHEKRPRSIKKVLEALLNAVPFVFVSIHLATAILLFTLVRIYDIYNDARNPNPRIADVFWTMAMLCVQSGIFFAFVVFVKL